MEEKQYETIVKTYLNDVFRLALSISQNEADAADIAQSVFIRLADCRIPFESDAHIKNWLLKCTANEARSLLRSFWKRGVCLQDEEIDQFGQPDRSENVLDGLLARLSKTERTLITLYYFQELDQKTIAGIMGMSVTNVSTRLSRIRKKLKRMLEEEEDDL